MEDSRFDFADRIALAGIAAGLSGAAVGVAFPLAYPDLVSIHTWRAVLWISLIVLIFSIGRLLYDVVKEIKKTSRSKAIKLVLGISALCVFLIWYLWPQDQFDRRLNGLGAYAVFRLYDTPESKRKYIFHLSTQEGARADFYISAADIITLSVTDIHGEAYNLEVPLGRVPLDRFIALFAEVGIDDDTTALRIVIDGKEIQRRTLPFVIELGNRQWKSDSIASDDGKNGTPLKFEEMGVWDKTFSNEKIGALMENIRKYVGPTV